MRQQRSTIDDNGLESGQKPTQIYQGTAKARHAATHRTNHPETSTYWQAALWTALTVRQGVNIPGSVHSAAGSLVGFDTPQRRRIFSRPFRELRESSRDMLFLTMTGSATKFLGLTLFSTVACTSIVGVDEYDKPRGGSDDGSDAKVESTGSGGTSSEDANTSSDGSTDDGTTGGTAGSVGGETCLNGKDDDGDGDVDCADSDCSTQGYSCAPTPPESWHGPFAYWVGAPPHLPCPTTYPTPAFKGWSDLVAPSASCECSCGKIGDDCEAQVGHWKWTANPQCGDSPTGNWYSGKNCDALPSGNIKIFGFRSTATCKPQVSKKNLPKAIWKTGKQLCKPPTYGSCLAPAQVCLPPLSSPYASKNCIAKAGAHSCPSPYLTAHQLFQDKTDNRDCVCGCDVNHGSCSASVSFPVNSCTTGIKPKVGECKLTLSTAAKISVNVSQTSITGNATCTPTKKLVGEAKPSNQVTVCCL